MHERMYTSMCVYMCVHTYVRMTCIRMTKLTIIKLVLHDPELMHRSLNTVYELKVWMSMQSK
jgi:hypothetical protein